MSLPIYQFAPMQYELTLTAPISLSRQTAHITLTAIILELSHTLKLTVTIQM